MKLSPFLQIADALRKNGYAPHPILPCSKKAFLENWQRFSDVLPTEENIAAWGQLQNVNIAVILGRASNLCALDFDYNIDGLHEKVWAAIPHSPVIKVGKKGFTAFYQYDGQPFKRWTKNRQIVLELLTAHHKTMLPPSIHPEGDVYKWTTEATLLNTVASELPHLPDNLFTIVNDIFGIEERVTQQNHVVTDFDIDDIREALQYLYPDDYSLWLKVGMALKSSFPVEGFQLWELWSERGIKYNPDELQAKWDSFNSEGVTAATILYDAAKEGFILLAKIVSSAVSPVPHHPVPETGTIDFGSAPGLVGEIATWINAIAIYPQPALALSSAIAAAGMIMGHKICSETDLRTNIYTLAIAPSGAGKDHARKCILSLFHRAGYEKYIHGIPVSGAGLITELHNSGGKCLVQGDEFGRVMQSINHKNAAAHQHGIPTLMMELFSTSNSYFLDPQLANRDGKTPPRNIDQPCLNFSATTTPKEFYEALTGSDTTGGFLARWLIFESDTYCIHKSKGGRVTNPPLSLVDNIKKWGEYKTTDPLLAGVHKLSPAPITIYFTAEAREIANSYSEKYRALIAEGNAQYAAIFARMEEHAVKLALIAHEGDYITEEVLRWAMGIVDYSCAKLIAGIERYTSQSNFESETKKVLEILQRNGDWMTLSDIYKQTRNLRGAERIEIINTLVEMGEAEAKKVTSDNLTKPVTLIRAM